MDLEIIKEPEIFILRNFLEPEKNNQILLEITSNKKHFGTATVSQQNRIDLKLRNNLSCGYDKLYNYNNQQKKSILLEGLYAKFLSQELRDIVFCAKGAINTFPLTQKSEVQASRYGDTGQKYGWHYDAFDGLHRMVTLVYYVFKEPKKFTGGEIQFSNAPCSWGKLLKCKPDPIITTLEPENNMAVIFSSKLAHRVLPTSSPKSFINGRFSINCWLGINLQ